MFAHSYTINMEIGIALKLVGSRSPFRVHSVPQGWPFILNMFFVVRCNM